jgi:hypothetical protein
MARLRAKALAEDLLRDRAARAARKAAPQATAKVDKGEFDPFPVTRWRVVAGGNPGYLAKAPMRRGPVGWFIVCRACAVEFESKGWAYCPSCMDLPAEARRREAASGGLPPYLTPARSHRNATPAISTPINGQKTQCQIGSQGNSANLQNTECLVGPADFPINIIGGRRLPQEQPNPLGRVYVRLWRT